MNSPAKFFLIISLAFAPLCAVQASDLQLKTMIRTVYPESVAKSSVDDLINYILAGTDYRLYVGINAPTDARAILAKRPGYQRKRVLMTRIDAILVAIGDGNSLIVDHENKLISVTRNPIYDI